MLFILEDIWIPHILGYIMRHPMYMHVLQIVPQHTILCDKNNFFKLSLDKSKVNTILGLINLIQGFRRTNIILPSGTKIHINDVFYSTKSKRNLLSFKDICRNGYYIETMNNGSNKYLLITSVISGKKHILKKLPSYPCGYIKQS